THLVWNYTVLILLCLVHSSFAPPSQRVLEKIEAAPNKFKMKLKDAYELHLSFFKPVTCSLKREQTLIPCHVGEGLNITKCLENRCCPSETSHKLRCYMPFKDDVQLAFRVLVLVAGGFVILWCLPFCCSACLQRSQCFNPLQKMNKEVEQVVLKRRERSEHSYSHLP
ncbi:FMR1N protein, partial [Zapornia atra]|nr:FMR1N protein [Zapornia atra]